MLLTKTVPFLITSFVVGNNKISKTYTEQITIHLTHTCGIKISIQEITKITDSAI